MGGEEVCEFLLSSGEADVVAETGFGASAVDAGLIGVDFPGVDVEHRGAAGAFDAGDRGGREAAGEEAEIAAADGDSQAVDFGCRWREFFNRAVGSVDRVDLFFRPRHAVAIVAGDRENAAVVGKSLLGEDVERPKRSLDNRETGGSVRGRSDAAGVVNRVDRIRDVGSELLGREVVDEAVPVTVRGDLVAGLGDPADQCGETLGNPAEDKERRPDFAPVEQC